MLQATISLRRVGLQLPTAKPDLDQAYQDRDAENAIGYNTLDTLFVYNPLNLTCVAFFFDFLFLTYFLCAVLIRIEFAKPAEAYASDGSRGLTEMSKVTKKNQSWHSFQLW